MRLAEASVPADKKRILQEIEASEGGYGALNRMGIGSISGAIYAMHQGALLKAVAGDTAPLAALQSTKELDEAMRGAAAAGFLEPLHALLARKVSVESATGDGRTPLVLACQGGHEHCAPGTARSGGHTSWPSACARHRNCSHRLQHCWASIGKLGRQDLLRSRARHGRLNPTDRLGFGSICVRRKRARR